MEMESKGKPHNQHEADEDHLAYSWESFKIWFHEYWRLKLLLPTIPNELAPKNTHGAVSKAFEAWHKGKLPSESAYDRFTRYVLWLQSLEPR